MLRPGPDIISSFGIVVGPQVLTYFASPALIAALQLVPPDMASAERCMFSWKRLDVSLHMGVPAAAAGNKQDQSLQCCHFIV
jgi:hypothetical protein